MIRQVTVKTPQFKGGEIFDHTEQIGLINTNTWEFEPIKHISGIVGKHWILFHNEQQFLKYQIKK